ncbi:type II toxin-antitoxin system RelE/ParE family toxin [Rhizobium sp. TRM95796]|uniref:type II toxin-antitoxin system RelE/ParE family toxin n=1 Tax=Rhizobium sp. TRM95796 TaxID=2979862 RepID=UPI0021E808B9|nr:type II toxin-antitoxin system RelE/ParE family toxin [Rhizobium sp. TRM95796]MCV3766079.1 type II toxin-antitoxin system RelE/ParE family toxin [Rhizobium sp. TRM95796]
MQRLDVAYRPQAINDLKAIHFAIAEASQSYAVADRFVNRIMARCRKIGDAPHGGRKRDDLVVGLRSVPFERSAIITYTVTEDRVEISNIFFSRRDYEALYRAQSKDELL